MLAVRLPPPATLIGYASLPLVPGTQCICHATSLSLDLLTVLAAPGSLQIYEDYTEEIQDGSSTVEACPAQA